MIFPPLLSPLIRSEVLFLTAPSGRTGNTEIKTHGYF
jgi:hypothetical protein